MVRKELRVEMVGNRNIGQVLGLCQSIRRHTMPPLFISKVGPSLSTKVKVIPTRGDKNSRAREEKEYDIAYILNLLR